MKRKKQWETAAIIVLALVCAFLFLRLALNVRDVSASARPGIQPSRVRRTAQPVQTAALRPSAQAFPESPALNVALYDEVQAQPLRPPERDPFSFTPTPQQIQQSIRARQALNAAPAAPAGPPPPPPVPFKAVGYSVKAEGVIEAYLADSQQVYVLHEGEEFDKTYRVISITPAMIRIEDESSHQAAEIPFPQ
ncbi:MAG TPA: hypothetical protein VFZ08_06990 [Terriglobia bacterium]|nr:hypothetical protein [Terriglobia bacterium]